MAAIGSTRITTPNYDTTVKKQQEEAAKVQEEQAEAQVEVKNCVESSAVAPEAPAEETDVKTDTENKSETAAPMAQEPNWGVRGNNRDGYVFDPIDIVTNSVEPEPTWCIELPTIEFVTSSVEPTLEAGDGMDINGNYYTYEQLDKIAEEHGTTREKVISHLQMGHDLSELGGSGDDNGNNGGSSGISNDDGWGDDDPRLNGYGRNPDTWS